MKGYNYQELERQSEVLAEKLLRNKRIQEVKTNERLGWDEKKTEEFVLRLRQKDMALSPTNQFEVLTALQNVTKPSGIGSAVMLGDKYFGVVVQEKQAGKYSKFDLEERSLATGSEKIVKVQDFGSLSKESTTNALHKEDRQYIRLVAFEYLGSHKFGNEYLDEVLKEMKAGGLSGTLPTKKPGLGISTNQSVSTA